jgi:hypothetical protein
MATSFEISSLPCIAPDVPGYIPDIPIVPDNLVIPRDHKKVVKNGVVSTIPITATEAPVAQNMTRMDMDDFPTIQEWHGNAMECCLMSEECHPTTLPGLVCYCAFCPFRIMCCVSLCVMTPCRKNKCCKELMSENPVVIVKTKPVVKK